MSRDVSQAVERLRVLAARMRTYAGETSVKMYRRQFERAASELEETAIDLESRQPQRGRRSAG